MSAPALRAPARTWAAARAYLGLLAHGWTILGLLLSVLYTAPTDREWLERFADGPFGHLRALALLMFFFPLLHWRGRGGRRVPDPAMPLGTMRHELVRLACGTAWAAATFGIATAIHTWRVAALYPEDPRTLGGYPHWYPFSLFAAGITVYLLGSAVLLRSERPGRVILFFAVLIGLVLPSGALARLLTAFRDADDLARLGTPEWLGGTVLSLGLACAVVYAAVRLDLPRGRAPAGAAGRIGDAMRRGLRRAVPSGPARPPVGRAGFRRPPSTLAVARRHLALLGRRMAWPMVLALLFAWGAARAEMEAGRTVPRFADFTRGDQYRLLALVSLCWPVFVWMDERRVLSEQDEALPVGAAKRRMLHAGAGAAWLLLAVLLLVAGQLAGAAAAGTLASPADVPPWLWPGLPCAVLTLYLFGTVGAILLEGPVVSVFVSYLVMLFGSFLWGDGALSPRRVLGAFWLDDPREWGYPAALFWLALCAAAATGAIALSAWADRNRRWPGLGDVRRLLRSRARPAPAAPLRGHAGG